MNNLYTELVNLLSKDERLTSEGKLLKNKIVELAYKIDKDLIKLLLSNPRFKELFFQDVEGVLVFNQSKFQTFISNKEFLPDSFTSFKNKIGLTNENGEFISQSKEVVLSFPYKDCVLEGGQDKEDAKRDEIFYNKILASDEIDRLFEPKVLTNFRKFDKDGEHKISEISENDNLIIKGNNLLAIHSLSKIYSGKVDFIYIDPPYNTGSQGDTFAYNNSFKHSSWLVFIKNRLEIAYKLLKDDGIICVTIDDYELPRLWILLEEIFGEENHLGTVVIRNNPKGRMTQRKFSLVHEYGLFFGKSSNSYIKKLPVNPEDKSHNYIKDENGEWYLPVNLRKQGVDSNAINKRGKMSDRYYPIYFNPETGEISTKIKHKVEILPIDSNNEQRIWRRGKEVIDEMYERKELIVKETANGLQIYFKFRGGLDGQLSQSIWYDSKFSASEYGTRTVDKLLGKRELFSYPKSPEAVKESILASTNDDNAIILDFFAGSGTTAQAVLDLNKEDGGNRKFILVEQLDYIEIVTTKRVHEVIKQNKGGEFVRVDLMESNEKFLNDIQDSKELRQVLHKIKQSGFLTHKVDLEKLDESEFAKLSQDEQRSLLMEILDANHLYVNLDDIDDARFKVSDEDKQLNKQFYSI